jgi:sugar phosphate permease
VIAGCGASMAIPAGQNAVMNAVPRDAIGKASGVYNTARQLGGVFGIAILAAVFAAKGGYASAGDFRASVGTALGVAAGMSALGAIAALLMRRRQPASATPALSPVTAAAADATAR